MRIAIVGGSVAGCALHEVLARSGYSSTLFERAAKPLMHRGAGLFLPQTLFDACKEARLLPTNFTSLPISHRPIHVGNDLSSQRLVVDQPLPAHSVHWGSIYQSLLSHLKPNDCRFGSVIQAIEENDDEITLIVNDEKHRFDFCFFADGHHSLGRQYLFPDLVPEFADYVAWRGTLGRVDHKTSAQLLDAVPFYMYDKGHLLLYAIPDVDGTNDYLINWVLYEDTSGNHPLFSDLPFDPALNCYPHDMPEVFKSHIRALARRSFPTFPRDIILQTEYPFMQSVHDVLVPNLTKGRAAICGDASTLLRPHVGAGAGRAFEAALSLGKALQMNSDFSVAIKQWSDEQAALSEKQFIAGRQIAEMFVTNMPDWSTLTEEGFHALWQQAIAGQGFKYDASAKCSV